MTRAGALDRQVIEQRSQPHSSATSAAAHTPEAHAARGDAVRLVNPRQHQPESPCSV